MIREIAAELQVILRTQKCPVPVFEGPEPTETTTWGRERVVIEHDVNGRDSFIGPRSQGLNPRLAQVRIQALTATIYVQSAKAGARVFEHRRRANAVLDQIVAGLLDIGALRRNDVVFTGGKFFTPKDLEGTDVPGGAAYELTFTFERGITKANFVDAKQPEALPGQYGVANSTQVGSDSTVVGIETSCGA